MVDVLEGGDLKKWNCIYPAYINSNRSIKVCPLSLNLPEIMRFGPLLIVGKIMAA